VLLRGPGYPNKVRQVARPSLLMRPGSSPESPSSRYKTASGDLRRRESRWIWGGWCCALAAWSFASVSNEGFEVYERRGAQTDQIETQGRRMDVDPLADFYAKLAADPTLTGDEAVQTLASWTGSPEQRERMLSDGERKLVEAEAMTELDWREKAKRFRLGAEATVTAAPDVPGRLLIAADAFVASGDLLQLNGVERDAGIRYTRAVSVYDRIISIIGPGANGFHDKVKRHRSAAMTALQRLQVTPPSPEPGKNQP